MDYMGERFPVSFDTEDTRATFSIPIINDDVYEPDEDFSLVLEIPRSTQDILVVRGDKFLANVIIEDDESEY